MAPWALPGVLVSVMISGADSSSIEPPKSARIVRQASANGVQIYACEVVGSAFLWVLKAPEASLFDETGRQVGKHFGGPSWQSSDGSLVTGELIAKAASPISDAIPWLLLRAKSHAGAGEFAPVSYIQRTETKGGLAPASGCDSGHQGAEARMRYSAIYTFYADGP
jgi:hypothetical protein